MLLRLFLLLHARGHRRHRPVDGVEVGQLRQILDVVDAHRLRDVERARSEIEFGGHGEYA